MRNGVAVFDQSSFVKFTVRGPDALDVLDTLSVASTWMCPPGVPCTRSGATSEAASRPT